MSSHQIRATVSGSFRKHLAHIESIVDQLKAAGIEVLSPRRFRPKGEANGFVRVSGDHGSDRQIEIRHLRAIFSSDLLYVVNPGGYIGMSTALEIGAAISASVPVLALETPSDPMLAQFTTTVAPTKVPGFVRHRNGHGLPALGALSRLQRHFRTLAERRGFADESPRDLVLLLVEEVGELASAVRRQKGLSCHETEAPDESVEFELADCFIYILSLANSLDIDIEQAVRRKETLNSRRTWVRPPKAIK